MLRSRSPKKRCLHLRNLKKKRLKNRLLILSQNSRNSRFSLLLRRSKRKRKLKRVVVSRKYLLESPRKK